MKKEYNFTKGVRAKFYRPNKVQKTLRLDKEIIEYFESFGKKEGIPYQTLINLVLRKFVVEKPEITLKLR